MYHLQDFDRKLSGYEGEMESVQASYQALSPNRKTPEIESGLSSVLERWDHLWSHAKLYGQR